MKKTDATLALEAAEKARLDAIPMTVRCAEPGCGRWSFSGTTAEAKQAAEAHREERHPGIFEERRGRRAARLAEEARRKKEAREAMTARLNKRPPAPKPKRTRAVRFTETDALQALRQATAEAGGRPPSTSQWEKEGRKPSVSVFTRMFGSWGGAVEAAGFTYVDGRTRRYERREAA